MKRRARINPYKQAAGGWGSAYSLANILVCEHVPIRVQTELNRQNKPDGFACVSCAWTKPIARGMNGFRATGYDIPPGCCATYYPEANALLPLSHYAHGSFTPAAKSIPVKLAKA